MNIFDDLTDPLGPPEGDALGTVLARARRRRAARRAAAVLSAVATVVVVAVSANALVGSSNGSHPVVTAVSPSPTTATTTPPDTTSSSSTSTSGPTTTTSTAPPVGTGEVWSGTHLTITPASLGAVRTGMTLAEAQSAAGVVFDGAADGAFYPTALPPGQPHLSVGEDTNSRVDCFAAEMGVQTAYPERVVTLEGFKLGDTVQRLKQIYGSRARFVPAPSSGISPRAGYVVSEPDGNLAFYVDTANTQVLGIKGGGPDLTPSTCNG